MVSLNFLLRKGVHCLHRDLLCECSWVIELEVSGTNRQKGTSQNSNTATLLLIWSAEHHQRTTAPMQNTVCRYIYVFDMYIFWYLFISSWALSHGLLQWYVCADNFSWRSRGKNDTKTIPERYHTIWEPWAGGRPPAHKPEQNIDTLSLGATYSHSIFHGWKQWLEKRKRRTKQSNKYST